MPKQRPPFDVQRYEAFKAKGLSQRAIAEQMGMPEATFRNNLKVLAQAVAQSAREGLPMDDQGILDQETPAIRLGNLEGDPRSIPEGDNGIPQLYVHQVYLTMVRGPVGAEDIEGVHESIPALPLTGIQEGDQSPPSAGFSPDLVGALSEAWPQLQEILIWWRTRQQHAQEPSEKLERATYHVAPTWIAAIRREADLTGESYAAVVNRAFAMYFRGKPA